MRQMARKRSRNVLQHITEQLRADGSRRDQLPVIPPRGAPGGTLGTRAGAEGRSSFLLMVPLPLALTTVQGSDRDLRVPESQKHKPHPGSCLRDLGAQMRLLCSALNSGLEDSKSERRAKTLQSLSAKSCSSGWAPVGGTRDGDTETETHRGRSKQPQRPLHFMQMGTGVHKPGVSVITDTSLMQPMPQARPSSFSNIALPRGKKKGVPL